MIPKQIKELRIGDIFTTRGKHCSGRTYKVIGKLKRMWQLKPLRLSTDDYESIKNWVADDTDDPEDICPLAKPIHYWWVESPTEIDFHCNEQDVFTYNLVMSCLDDIKALKKLTKNE